MTGLVAFKGERTKDVSEEGKEDCQSVGDEEVLGTVGVDVSKSIDSYCPIYCRTAIVSLCEGWGLRMESSRDEIVVHQTHCYVECYLFN